MVKLVLLICAIGLVLPPTAASAASGWMGTAYAGYAKTTENSDDARFTVPNGGLGLHGGFYRMFQPALGLGAEIGYQDYGEEPHSFPAQTNGSVGFSSAHLTLQGIAQGTRGTVRPFGLIGAGWYPLHTKTEGLSSFGTMNDGHWDSKFGANLGGGVLLKPSTWSMGVGLEARWHMIFDSWPTKEGTSTLDAVTLAGGVHFP